MKNKFKFAEKILPRSANSPVGYVGRRFDKSLKRLKTNTNTNKTSNKKDDSKWALFKQGSTTETPTLFEDLLNDYKLEKNVTSNAVELKWIGPGPDNNIKVLQDQSIADSNNSHSAEEGRRFFDPKRVFNPSRS